VRNIWILAENKYQFLWKINLLGAISNVLLNYVLIPICGAIGAAWASLITQFFTNVIVGFMLPPIRKNNTLMIRGLNIVGTIRKFLF
jgi:Na+-driven multidrug efflux pump